MQVTLVKLDDLRDYERNSRTHSEAQVAQVAASIKEFGFTNPVLIDASGGIIAGHGRVLAARSLGLSEVPCIRLTHLTDAQRRAYIIADNKLAMNSGWDASALAVELRELQGMDFDMSLTGFAEGELADLVFEKPEEKSGEDDVPPIEEAVISKIADVWTLGAHRLMCGDSTKADQVHKLLGGALRILWLPTRLTALNTIRRAPATIRSRRGRCLTMTAPIGVTHGLFFLAM